MPGRESRGYRRAVVTGGAGFIGSHLAEQLIKRGCQVTVIDNLSAEEIANVTSIAKHPCFRFVFGSVRDEHLMKRVIAECDDVYHLAAVMGVERVLTQPEETWETNTVTTEIVCHFASMCSKRMLFTSSSEVYGVRSTEELKESDADLDMEDLNPYGRSKALCEKVVKEQ